MKKSITLKICLCAVMAALSVVLDMISIKVDIMSKITIYGLPLMFTSIFYGPILGVLTGLVSGFISQLLQYGFSITMPIWMLAPVLWGLIGGLIQFIFKPKKPYSLLIIFIVVLVTSLFVTMANTLAIYLDGLVWHYTTEQTILTVLARCGIAALMCIPYTYILYLICNRLKQYSWLK